MSALLRAKEARDGGCQDILGHVTVRATDTGDGIIINAVDAKEWGLREDAPYACTWVDDTHVRIAIPAALRNLKEARAALEKGE